MEKDQRMTDKLSGRQAIEARIAVLTTLNNDMEDRRLEHQQRADAIVEDQQLNSARIEGLQSALEHFPEPAKKGRPSTNGTAPARKPRKAKPALGSGLGDLVDHLPPAA